MIEGFLLNYISDNNEFLDYFNKFIYKIDNWSICDSCIASYKIMKKNDFSDVAYSLILDSHEFIQRVGYIMLLDYYIDDNHIDTISVCFIKSRTKTLELLKSKNLSVFVQNKTISKIRESYRVSNKDKELIIKLKK